MRQGKQQVVREGIQNTGPTHPPLDHSSCETSFDTTKAIPTTMHMQGWGSDNTATGLEFVCTFNVEYYNAATRDSLTKCQCSLHVDIPYTKSNHWYVDCPCLQGFTYSMPKKDHVFVASDTVTGKA